MVSSPSNIKLSMEYMKNLFIREYNSLYDTVQSGSLDMLGVNKVKDYVQKWIKGKAKDYLDANTKQWMDKFGTHAQEFDTISKDIKGMSSFDLTKALPKNVVQKISSYQNKLVKFIQDVLALGE